MNARTITVLAVFELVALTAAQDPGRPQDRRGPRGPDRMLQRLQDSLGLDEAQQEQVRQILSAARAGQDRDRFRQLRQDLRQARQDGDDARASELQRQMGELASARAASMQQSLGEIERILNDDQRAAFSQMRQRFEGNFGRGGPRRGPGRMLQRAAESLDLDPQQREKLDEIASAHRDRMAEAMPLFREMRQARRDGDEARAQELRAQMYELGIDPPSSIRQAMDELEPILDQDQRETLQDLRQSMEQRERMRRMPDELDMDQEQRSQYRQLIQTQRDLQRQQMDLIRPLRRELREARAAGDRARIEQLQADLDLLRSNPEQDEMDFLDQVKELLRDDQVPALDAYYLNVVGTTPKKTEDVRALLRAALRAHLDRRQRAQWRLIMRESMRARYQARRDKQAQATVAAETRKKIERMLTEEQLELFERELQRTKGRSSSSRRTRRAADGN